MRRTDKKTNMVKANLLAEHRYMKSKGLVNEEVETAPYDANIPMREITQDEIDELIKKTREFASENMGFDPYQDYSFEYISRTQYHHIETVTTVDKIYMVKLPEDAYIGKIVGNMNYTDAYKNNN
tara:strand:- start:52 stop:426 length:375 start_codon:yes stop_codon:yes gene_type:complete